MLLYIVDCWLTIEKLSILNISITKARFKRRISVASNAIQTIDNELTYLIIFCLNCIRCDGNSKSKPGLNEDFYSICHVVLTTIVRKSLTCSSHDF